MVDPVSLGLKVGFNVSNLSALASSLISGNDNILEKLIIDKLENMGEDMLMHALGEFVTSPDYNQIPFVNEYERTRNQFLNSLTPSPLPYSNLINKFQNLFQGSVGSMDQGKRRPAKWARTDWATSRQDWLDNRWKHDWRSQPRDVLGRWIPGRMDHIAAYAPHSALHVGRVLRKQRKIKRGRRKFVRKLITGYVSAFGRE